MGSAKYAAGEQRDGAKDAAPADANADAEDVEVQSNLKKASANSTNQPSTNGTFFLFFFRDFFASLSFIF